MKKHIRSNKKQLATNLVNTFFKSVSTCGPRIIDAPNAKDDTKLCELFISYHHSMKQFYNLIEDLYAKPIIPIQESSSSFIETMEESLLKRQLLNKKNYRLGKDSKNQLSSIMSSKPQAEKKTTCSKTTDFGPTELDKKKKSFCKGSNRLDLSSNRNVENIAIYYLKDEISKHYKKQMISVRKNIRYSVTDTSCPLSKLFEAKDISIQQVAMDTKGKIKEWVAAIHLNTEDKNGYLQSELPYCNAKNYLISTEVKVKAYIDNENCCKGYSDFNLCKTHHGCEGKLLNMEDINNRPFSRDVHLIGADYTIKDTHHYKGSKRRRLFASTGSARGSCANRL